MVARLTQSASNKQRLSLSRSLLFTFFMIEHLCCRRRRRVHAPYQLVHLFALANHLNHVCLIWLLLLLYDFRRNMFCRVIRRSANTMDGITRCHIKIYIIVTISTGLMANAYTRHSVFRTISSFHLYCFSFSALHKPLSKIIFTFRHSM